MRFSTEQEAGDAVARSPREINGIKIGEIRIAEPRPGGKGGGGGGPVIALSIPPLKYHGGTIWV